MPYKIIIHLLPNKTVLPVLFESLLQFSFKYDSRKKMKTGGVTRILNVFAMFIGKSLITRPMSIAGVPAG